jgi:hypothetical protein
MPLHTISATFRDDAGSVPLGATVYNVPGEVNELILVPAGSVNLEKDFEFLHLKVVDYCVAVVQQTPAQILAGTYSEPASGTILINWNSTGAPAPAMTVNAKQPHVFAPALAGTTNEFTADITKAYFNNAGSADLSVVIKVGLNA